ncbi:carboxymuconolactone decarboxylase family protein [Agromyces seonyuensis]|uniref:Carboxymuconolactone decarboxylase family protein n=1 Tax=Agromyces seonyuensis TaxID=2662446 RepID=A0A6I4NXB8_9MICO|nr:carboxymuconolactone decarboxylase family protein [Agromyces seonyuensis]MWB98960.1 carboxymuconolactone decarboxylase family protein [Agromyces seonyuensis]
MIIETPEVEGADGAVGEMYDDDLRHHGMVFAHTRAMAVNPEAHAAFEALIGAIVPSIGKRTYELVTLAAARAIPSPHCLLAHGEKLRRMGDYDDGQLERIARDYLDAGLEPADLAVMAFAEKLSLDPLSMTDVDSQRLRDVGFTDRQIVDVALAAGVRNFFSRAINALAVPVEEVPGTPEPLVDALLSPLLD